ncbi:unnamed protein product, partial [Larinioides sclopetarius]
QHSLQQLLSFFCSPCHLTSKSSSQDLVRLGISHLRKLGALLTIFLSIKSRGGAGQGGGAIASLSVTVCPPPVGKKY